MASTPNEGDHWIPLGKNSGSAELDERVDQHYLGYVHLATVEELILRDPKWRSKGEKNEPDDRSTRRKAREKSFVEPDMSNIDVYCETKTRFWNIVDSYILGQVCVRWDRAWVDIVLQMQEEMDATVTPFTNGANSRWPPKVICPETNRLIDHKYLRYHAPPRATTAREFAAMMDHYQKEKECDRQTFWCYLMGDTAPWKSQWEAYRHDYLEHIAWIWILQNMAPHLPGYDRARSKTALSMLQKLVCNNPLFQHVYHNILQEYGKWYDSRYKPVYEPGN